MTLDEFRGKCKQDVEELKKHRETLNDMKQDVENILETQGKPIELERLEKLYGYVKVVANIKQEMTPFEHLREFTVWRMFKAVSKPYKQPQEFSRCMQRYYMITNFTEEQIREQQGWWSMWSATLPINKQYPLTLSYEEVMGDAKETFLGMCKELVVSIDEALCMVASFEKIFENSLTAWSEEMDKRGGMPRDVY